MRTILFKHGPPGCGKGTQAKMLAKNGWRHVEMSKILTDPPFANTPLGRQVKEDMDAGRLIHDSIVVSVLEDYLRLCDDERIIIDGFPRTLYQARYAVDSLGQRHNVRFVIYDLDDEECVARVSGRKTQRKDDDPKTHQDRLVRYRRSERRIKSFLLTRLGGKGVHIQYAGLPADEIHQQVQNALSAS